MENLRYMLAAVAAFTLVMSVVSSVNPAYFYGVNAFAENDNNAEQNNDNSTSSSGSDGAKDQSDDAAGSEETENDNNSTSTEEHQQGHDNKDKQQQEHERDAQSKSKVETEDNGTKIELELQGLNMTDGSYNAVFACEGPAFNMTLDGALEVQDGEGKLEQTIGLANGTYSGCDLTIEGTDTVLASFNTFTVGEESEEDDHGVEQKHKENRSRIVSTTNSTAIHEKHRGEKASSPGQYDPNWNYTLVANGTAITIDGNETSDAADATVKIDMAVWKSTGSIILFDVLNGTVEIDNQTYTVVLGYSLYTLHHDAFKVGALAVDDDGNVLKLKLSGTGDDEAEFPLESGSIDLTFEGNSGPSNSRLGDWQLTMDGTVTAG